MRKVVLTALGFLGSLVMTFLLLTGLRGEEAAAVNNYVKVALPHQIQGTTLVVENTVCYEGVFLESRIGEEVSAISGLLIRNAGQQGIENADITVIQGERVLHFALSQLPPLASVLVLESTGQKYVKMPLQSCSGIVKYESNGWDPEAYVAIRENNRGELEVTNIGLDPLVGLRLYYKPEYAEGEFYLGGITREIEAGTLEPGQTVCLSPDNYCPGVSRILRIAYDE